MGNCQNAFQSDNINQSNGNQHNQELKISGITWIKDSHGLFDYETQNIIKQELKVNESGRIVRKENEIRFQKEDQVQNEDEEILLNIFKDEQGLFWVDSSKRNEDIQNQWTVVKNVPSENGFILRQGDLMKLGRVNFKIKELVLDQNWQMNNQMIEKKSTNVLEADNTDVVTDFEYHQTQDLNHSKRCPMASNNNNNNLNVNNKNRQQHMGNDLDEFQNNTDNNISFNQPTSNINNGFPNNCSCNNMSNLTNNIQQQQQQQNNRICRICLSEETNDNPLVNPCKCQGTMKYLHINCLQTWIYSKMQISHKQLANQKIIFLTKNFECELCKSKYPSKFQSEGSTYDIQELSRPAGQLYAGIEVMQTSHNRANSSGYYIIQLKKNQTQKFHIGRSHESEIRISDISVSRQHACLYWNGQQLFIQDKESKFGSLVQVKQEIPLTKDLDGFAIQCGRTTVQFHFSNKSNNCQLFRSCMNQMQTTQSEEDIDNNSNEPQIQPMQQSQQQQQENDNHLE